jgi:prophage DNA circulation protein
VSTQSDAFAAASVALATAISEATTDPADAVRLLLPLCQFEPVPVFGSGPLANTIMQWQYALASNLRVAALAALAQACAEYQPVSYQDAQSLRFTVCDAIAAEATLAADMGNDAIYHALHSLKVAVAIDLAWRGATLPMLVEVTTLVSMPSLAEAYELYQNTSREPALVASADPPHPLFLPLSFPALSR